MLAEEYQKLFESLCAMNDEDLQSLWDKNEIRKKLQSFQNRISSASSEKWISVNDRLPEINTLVLVFRDGCYSLSEIYMYDMVEGTPMWSYTGLGGEPSHWMPLPQHPR